MLKYYLAGQEVAGPLHVDGLTLKKSRNRKYWGFLYRKLGYVEGANSLRFEEADAVTLIQNAIAEYSIQAETSFRIEQNGETLYDGFLDYATYSDDGDGISIGLRDNRAVLDLSVSATTTYAITPGLTMAMHERRLGGLPSLITDPNTLTIQRSESSAVPITHAVPLTRRAETDDTIDGTLVPVVVPLLSDPCYRNTSNKAQVVKLRGLVSGVASSFVTQTVTLRAVASGNESGAIAIGSKTITATPTSFDMAVSVDLTVAAGESLKLEWIGSSNTPKWIFTYNDKTKLSLSDEKSYGSSVAYTELLLSVFKSLVKQTTSGALTFRSDWLRKGDGYGLMLTNGAGVRAINKPLSVSLDGLFTGLSGIYNLAMWIDNSVVRLEPKGDQPRRMTVIDTLLTRREVIATEFLYNSVKAGYDTWQEGTGTLTNDEPNGQRTYSTRITTVRNELNLISELITASTVIETQRRKQFDPKTASENKADSLDEKLFLICAIPSSGGWKAETGERTQYAAGNYDTGTLYNIRLTPGRNLRRWESWLAPSLPLTNQTVLGSDSLVSICDEQILTENDPVPFGSSLTPFLVTITTPMDMLEYSQLGDTILYPYRGLTAGGELLDAEWRLAPTGEVCTLTILER